MSIWNLKENRDTIKELDKNIKVDTLIIGAGLTGLNTAYYLKDFGNVVVVEASVFGHGVTLNTTAKINYLQERIYTKIKSLRGEKLAKIYLNSQKSAIDKLINIIKKEKIECDLKKVPSYIFANTKKEISKLNDEVKFLKNNKIDIKKGELPDKITTYSSYYVEDTYVFNPYKYLKGLYNLVLKSGIMVYENTRVIDIRGDENNYEVLTSKGFSIKAKKIVFGCHYPYFKMPFFLPIKSTIEKSYIIVSKVEKDKGFTCISTGRPVYSCRFYDDGENIYQISLGESHNSAFDQNDEYHFNRIKEIFNLKEKNIILRYSNSDIMTVDYMPYIGKIKNNMYIGCGYNTWGMTNSVLAASLISDCIKGKENKLINYFSPKRLTLANLISLPSILFSQSKSFFGAKINKNKPWYCNEVRFYKENGINYAVYTDEQGVEHRIINKCPHLGCRLIFNKLEKTWDCPCHSSRFDIDGKCIKGPSNYDISK